MKRLPFALGLCLAVLVLTACPIYPYDPGYDPPELYDFEGDWSGAVKDSVGGTGSLNVTVTFQSRSGNLGGEWEVVFGEDTVGGVFNGNAYNSYESSEGEVKLRLIPAAATGCILESTGVNEDGKLSATYNASPTQPAACADLAFGVGTFTITKQLHIYAK